MAETVHGGRATNDAILQDLRRRVQLCFEGAATASSDMGNVSHVVPSIQPGYAIPCEAGNHNPGFTAAAATPQAHAAALRAAKAMAMTALDVCVLPDVLAAAQVEFRASRPR
ncbi:MAG: hypothetical protein ACYDCQ_13925 [Dehalococcoidia bacterium]